MNLLYQFIILSHGLGFVLISQIDGNLRIFKDLCMLLIFFTKLALSRYYQLALI